MIITESRSLAGVLRDLASEYLTPIASTNLMLQIQALRDGSTSRNRF